MKKKTPRLGKGLSHLMAQSVAVQASKTAEKPVESTKSDDNVENMSSSELIQLLDISLVKPNKDQPRRIFLQSTLEGLAQSIRNEGIMQPIIVRRDDKTFQIVAGERRWRAAQLANLEKIPAIVRELSDRQVAEWAIVENLQREDLNPIDRSTAFQRLIDQYELSHDEIAQRVGVDRSTITNSLRLLKLHPEVQSLVASKKLTNGHAKVLAGITDEDEQKLLAGKCIRLEWSVRQLEAQAKADKSDQASSKRVRRSAHFKDLEQQIGAQIGTRVSIKSGRKKGSGTLSLEFFSIDQFDELLDRLKVDVDL